MKTLLMLVIIVVAWEGRLALGEMREEKNIREGLRELTEMLKVMVGNLAESLDKHGKQIKQINRRMEEAKTDMLKIDNLMGNFIKSLEASGRKLERTIELLKKSKEALEQEEKRRKEIYNKLNKEERDLVDEALRELK